MTHRRRADLTDFFERSTKIRGRLANTFYLVQDGNGEIEGYVLASKKGVSKLATERNRAKRRLRVAQRTVLDRFPCPAKSCRVRWVIMAGRGSLKASWPDILKEVEQQWKSVIATLA